MWSFSSENVLLWRKVEAISPAINLQSALVCIYICALNLWMITCVCFHTITLLYRTLEHHLFVLFEMANSYTWGCFSSWWRSSQKPHLELPGVFLKKIAYVLSLKYTSKKRHFTYSDPNTLFLCVCLYKCVIINCAITLITWCCKPQALGTHAHMRIWTHAQSLQLQH